MPASALESKLMTGGVYFREGVAGVAELKALAKKSQFKFFHLEGQHIEKKEQFFNQAETVFHFPDYFGHNWDGFEECMTDLSWCEAKGYIVLFDHVDAFQAHHAQELQTAVEVLQDAVTYWNDEEVVFIVVLAGTHSIKGLAKI